MWVWGSDDEDGESVQEKNSLNDSYIIANNHFDSEEEVDKNLVKQKINEKLGVTLQGYFESKCGESNEKFAIFL